jgi:hypothetical protein
MRRLAALAVCALVLPAPAAAATTPIPGIRTPSRNISCLYVPGTRARLFCRIARADYRGRLAAHCAAPPIELDWAGFELGPASRGTVTCSGGVLYNPAAQRPVYVGLPYGGTWRHGTFTCASRVTGLTCATARGHGLFLSRESWRGW